MVELNFADQACGACFSLIMLYKSDLLLRMRKSWKWLHINFPARSLLREILYIHLRVVPVESENHCNESASIGEMGDKSKGLFIIYGILLHKSLSYKTCFVAFNRAI